MINIVSAIFIIGMVPVLISLIKNHYFLSSFFEIALRVGDVGGSDMLALPLAYSLGMIINCVLLFLLFQKNSATFGFPSEKHFLKFWEPLF